MIRVLHVFNMMGNGGIEHYVMDRYLLIDRTKIQFDFLITSETPGYFEQKIKDLGGKVYHTVNFAKHPLQSFTQTIRIVREGQYQFVHRHTGNAVAYVDLWAAKLGGAKHLILHSHNNSAKRVSLHSFCKRFLAFDCERLACSTPAGKWMFDSKPFTVMKNAIDTEKYIFQQTLREELRSKYGIAPDAFVVGHIGRLDYQKNHTFLLDIFSEVLKIKPNAVLVCVGDGFLKSSIEEKAESLHIRERLLLTGQVDNVHEIINCFDVFCLPSNYEGLPITLLEAQVNGLHCFASKKRVPEESNISGNVTYIRLEEKPDVWAAAICSPDRERDFYAVERVREAGYELNQSAEDLQNYYMGFANG